MFASQQQVIGMRWGIGRKKLITMKKKLALDGHQSCQRENERHVLQADWKHWATRHKPRVCDARRPTALQRPTPQWKVGHSGLICLYTHCIKSTHGYPLWVLGNGSTTGESLLFLWLLCDRTPFLTWSTHAVPGIPISLEICPGYEHKASAVVSLDPYGERNSLKLGMTFKW